MLVINWGFRRRPLVPELAERLPPGQHLVGDFPVLTAGPTPRPRLEDWTLAIDGAVDMARLWTWDEFLALPSQSLRDRHSLRDIVVQARHRWGRRVTRHSAGRGEDERPLPACRLRWRLYTNLRLAEVTGGKAWIAYAYDDQPLPAEHGGPARLLVPHLYFWKSAKWVRRLILAEHDRLGFWETNGYHAGATPGARSATAMTSGA